MCVSCYRNLTFILHSCSVLLHNQLATGPLKKQTDHEQTRAFLVERCLPASRSPQQQVQQESGSKVDSGTHALSSRTERCRIRRERRVYRSGFKRIRGVDPISDVSESPRRAEEHRTARISEGAMRYRKHVQPP